MENLKFEQDGGQTLFVFKLQSLRSHHDQLTRSFETMQFKPIFVGLFETWLCDKTTHLVIISLLGITILFTVIAVGGGGVAFLLKVNLITQFKPSSVQ